jgi:C4-dicarboxylate-specific signal transduction histidine kinase
VVEQTSLQTVLDNLRIIIEPEWREMGGVIRWPRAQALPNVCADEHGLLQVFLNLVQNSYRAIQDCAIKELTIRVFLKGGQVEVQLHDSGPGIPRPEHLFQPFRTGAEGSGLGLYISRAMVRSYGGELRFETGFEPAAAGACFTIELQVV